MIALLLKTGLTFDGGFNNLLFVYIPDYVLSVDF
jgi:hypothetical protein